MHYASSKLGYVNYDEDGNGDTEELDYEVPNKPFKYLFKFMGPSIGAIPKGIQVTNFEMLIREEPLEEVREPNGKLKSFKVGNITFYKRIPSCVKDRIAKEKKRIRNQLLELNFDKIDDWSNVNKHSHVLRRINNEGPMVLPEFIINNKYYSMHVLFESIEPLRKLEYLPPPFDNPFSLKRICGEPTFDRSAYVHWSAMIKDGNVVIQSEALQEFWNANSDLFYEYLETKVFLF